MLVNDAGGSLGETVPTGRMDAGLRILPKQSGRNPLRFELHSIRRRLVGGDPRNTPLSENYLKVADELV